MGNSESAWLLRPAQATDEPAIRALVRSERLNPFGLRWQRFVVAEAAGTVVGCAQVKPHRGGKEFASLVVAPGWRGCGLAAALIHHFVAQTRGPLWLMCAARLMPFYEPFGFRPAMSPSTMPLFFRSLFFVSRLFGKPHQHLAIMMRPLTT
ncbi:MAG: GNAT family N-acetyltransferase [Anaerolineales bacterium]|nr:GNAT family N-acetyltransferase [Anaerolineales bacterium]